MKNPEKESTKFEKYLRDDVKFFYAELYFNKHLRDIITMKL